MKLGGRIDISIVFLCIVKILSLLLMILHNSYFVQVTGCHNLSSRHLGLSKKNLSEEAFVNAIFPYFRQSGSEFINGLRLHTYFVKSQVPKKDELGDMTHVKFCKILKNMCNSIPPDLDCTLDGDIQKAQRCYKLFLKAGGTHGICQTPMPSQTLYQR